MRSREEIAKHFGALRDYRNLVAHHQPIWDRKPLEVHRRSVTMLGWMNTDAAQLVQACSRLEQVYNAGPESYRADAEASSVSSEEVVERPGAKALL